MEFVQGCKRLLFRAATFTFRVWTATAVVPLLLGWASAATAAPPSLNVLSNWGGAVNAVVVDPANPNIAYIGSGRRLVILDVSEPIPESGPPEIGSIDLGNVVYDVKVRDGYAYVATYSRPNYVCIVDVSTPASPQLAWHLTTSSFFAEEICLWGNQMFVRNSGHLDVWNISAFTNHQPNPTAVSIGRAVQAVAMKMEVVGDLMYMMDTVNGPDPNGRRVWIYDLTVPWASQFTANSKLHTVGVVQLGGTEGDGRALAVDGNFVYAATRCCPPWRDGRFAVINATTLSSPQVVYSSIDFHAIGQGFSTSATSLGIAAANGYLFVTDSENPADGGNWPPPQDGRGLAVFDVANPASPVLVGQYRTHGQVNGVRVVGPRAYVTNSEGIEIVDISNPAAPTSAGRYHSPGKVRSATQVGNLLYVTDTLYGVTALDISDPRRPQVVGSFQTPLNGTHHDSFDFVVDVDRQVGFLSAGYSGVESIDVSDPSHMTLVGELLFPPGAGWTGRGLALSGTTLQVGIRPSVGGIFYNIDVTDPANMNPLGSLVWNEACPSTILNRSDGVVLAGLSSDGFGTGFPYKVLNNGNVNAPAIVASAGTSVPDLAFVGESETVLAAADNSSSSSSSGFYLWDVTNVQSPTLISRFAMGKEYGVSVRGNRAYVTGRGITGSDLSRFHVFDISNLSAPVRTIGTYVEGAFRSRVDPRGVAYVTTDLCGLAIVDIREGPPGDCNNDGFLDMADAAMFTEDLLSGGSAFAADMNGDGKLDGKDIQPFVTALINAPPSNTPHGACCGNDGTCHDNVTPFSCQVDFGGTYQGNNTTCAGTTCPASGACCITYGNQPCLIRTQAACIGAGGTYQGDGVACETSDCVPGQYKNEENNVTLYVLGSTAGRIADDMTLGGGTSGRELNYLDLAAFGGNVGQDFDVTVNLFNGCPGAGGTIIPGATWQWFGVPDDGFFYVLTVDPVDPGITLPDTVWMEAEFSTTQSGWIVANQAEIGTTQDLYARNNPWICNATVSSGYSGLWANIRCNLGGGGGGGGGIMAPPGVDGSLNANDAVWNASSLQTPTTLQGSTPGARIRRSTLPPAQLRPVTADAEVPVELNRR